MTTFTLQEIQEKNRMFFNSANTRFCGDRGYELKGNELHVIKDNCTAIYDVMENGTLDFNRHVYAPL